MDASDSRGVPVSVFRGVDFYTINDRVFFLTIGAQEFKRSLCIQPYIEGEALYIKGGAYLELLILGARW